MHLHGELDRHSAHKIPPLPKKEEQNNKPTSLSRKTLELVRDIRR